MREQPAASDRDSIADGSREKDAALYRLFSTTGSSDEIIARMQEAKRAGATTDEIAQVVLAACNSDAYAAKT